MWDEQRSQAKEQIKSNQNKPLDFDCRTEIRKEIGVKAKGI